MIYIFRKYNSSAQIIIHAQSYLEAKDALYSLHPWADRTYNIVTYKMYHEDEDKYIDTLKIDNDEYQYPKILSEQELNLLVENKCLTDLGFNNIHNTQILTKNRAALQSTEEFVEALKINANNKKKVKIAINKMQNTVGDIWYIKYNPSNLHLYCDKNGNPPFHFIFGLGIKQCLNLYNKFDKVGVSPAPQKLISDSYGSNFTEQDIINYNILVSCMKTYKITKFPFDTLQEELKLRQEKGTN